MNNIREAADKLRKGWCQHDLVQSGDDNDKFCAVGALGSTILGSVVTEDEVDFKTFLDWEESCYKVVGDSEEAFLLAKTIKEQFPDRFENDSSLSSAWDIEEYDEMLYIFNDRAKNLDEVLSVFDKAAVVWDEKHS
jgi:hypothetical protein